MEHSTRNADATLDRNGLTTIETKRWLSRALYDDVDHDPVSAAAKEPVASD